MHWATSMKMIQFVNIVKKWGLCSCLTNNAVITHKAIYLEACWALYLRTAWTNVDLMVYILSGGCRKQRGEKHSLYTRHKATEIRKVK